MVEVLFFASSQVSPHQTQTFVIPSVGLKSVNSSVTCTHKIFIYVIDLSCTEAMSC